MLHVHSERAETLRIGRRDAVLCAIDPLYSSNNKDLGMIVCFKDGPVVEYTSGMKKLILLLAVILFFF